MTLGEWVAFFGMLFLCGGWILCLGVGIKLSEMYCQWKGIVYTPEPVDYSGFYTLAGYKQTPMYRYELANPTYFNGGVSSGAASAYYQIEANQDIEDADDDGGDGGGE